MTISDKRFLAALNSEPVKKDDRLYFISEKEFSGVKEEMQTGINKFKTLLKLWPGLYNFLQALFTPAFSMIGFVSYNKILRVAFGAREPKDKIILNLGSGTKRINPEIINVDIYPFKNVDVVADIRKLPFKDGSIDMVIVDSVLEHVGRVGEAIGEITRVVKPRGYVYATVPFVYPFHASPNDFYRWTQEGLKSDFAAFRPVLLGMRGGPMAALQGVLIHVFSLLLSFRIQKLYSFLTQFFMVVLAPLKLLDFIFILFPQSHEIGAHIYLLGRKRE